MNAADVVYSFDHARDDRWPYAEAALNGLAGLSMRVIDAHTVDITSTRLNDPPGLLLHVVPAHVYEKAADIGSDVAALGVGDGAWHVIASSPSSVELGVLGRPAGPPLDQIVFTTYKTPDALIDAISQRKVDVISGLPYSDINAPRRDAEAHGRPRARRDRVRAARPLADARRARAVSLAIDRIALVAAAVDGVGTPAAVNAEPGAAHAMLVRARRRVPGS